MLKMLLLTAAVLLPLLTGLQATYTGPKIRWGPCNTTEFINATSTTECGTLYVPLDYTNTTFGETLRLELLKVSAAVQPSAGSILLNFGGPGEIARGSLLSFGPLLQPLSGGTHDLIAFDPRGTGNTIPFDCQLDPDELFQTYVSQGKWPRNASDPQTAVHWAWGGATASICANRSSEIGSLLSSAFVARDLMSVVDALEEDGMLRYWGFSYGTTLGVTVAAMFPDRIDKIVLDGVQNPHEYYHALSDFEEWTDSDKLFSQIFIGCVSSPDTCKLAGRNQTALQLEESVWELIDAIYMRPVRVGNILIDYTAINAMIASAFYEPSGFPALAAFLDRLLDGDTTSPAAVKLASALAITGLTAVEASAQIGYSLVGIHCGDNNARVSTLDEFLPAAEELHRKSKIMGAGVSSLSKTCSQWTIEPKERYEGSFDVKTKNPILLIGNTWDGHTPLVSAKNVSATFEGSRVLEVQGWGHTSIPNPSLCSLRTMSSYWVNGTLPEEGAVCEVDAPLYSNVTWANILSAAAENTTSSVLRRSVSDLQNAGPIRLPMKR